MSEPLRDHLDSKAIQVLKGLQADGALNLGPGFQRESVWSLGDRRELIERERRHH